MAILDFKDMSFRIIKFNMFTKSNYLKCCNSYILTLMRALIDTKFQRQQNID